MCFCVISLPAASWVIHHYSPIRVPTLILRVFFVAARIIVNFVVVVVVVIRRHRCRRRYVKDIDEDKIIDEDSDQEKSWMKEKRKKDNEITALKRKIRALESTLNEMKRTSKGSGSDKTGWTGDELNFVKDINDFCRDRLYPREKFLRKNWQDFLPNDRRSLYAVCMKHLSIPEGSDPMEIWERVIIPSIRDKYQSMKCNMNNIIKSIYMSMRCLLVF